MLATEQCNKIPKPLPDRVRGGDLLGELERAGLPRTVVHTDRIVVTGPMSAGKSTLLKGLKREGVPCSPDFAEVYLTLQVAQAFLAPEFWQRAAKYVDSRMRLPSQTRISATLLLQEVCQESPLRLFGTSTPREVVEETLDRMTGNTSRAARQSGGLPAERTAEEASVIKTVVNAIGKAGQEVTQAVRKPESEFQECICRMKFEFEQALPPDAFCVEDRGLEDSVWYYKRAGLALERVTPFLCFTPRKVIILKPLPHDATAFRDASEDNGIFAAEQYEVNALLYRHLVGKERISFLPARHKDGVLFTAQERLTLAKVLLGINAGLPSNTLNQADLYDALSRAYTRVIIDLQVKNGHLAPRADELADAYLRISITPPTQHVGI